MAMDTYLCSYFLPHMQKNTDPLSFECMADDAAHAKEQLMDAEPKAEDVVCELYESAPSLTDATITFDDATIPEHIWEVTFQKPNGDWPWYRTSTAMTFQAACEDALLYVANRPGSGLSVIRIEKVPTIQPTTVVAEVK